MMRQVFADPALDERYRHEGYVVLPLLSPAGVAALADGYAALPAPSARGFHASLFGHDPRVRHAVSETIRARLGPPVQALLAGFRACTGNFVVKEAGPGDSTVPVHQDWTLVDEREHCSVNVWCPLADTTPENGPLQVFPGSHRFLHTLRGPGIPNPYPPLADVIRARHLRELSVRAGEAVLFDHRLVHCSPPNRTSLRRVVANLAMVPLGVPALHCHAAAPAPRTEVEVFEVDDAFFTRHPAGSRPAGVVLREAVRYACPWLSADELERLAAAAAPTPSRREAPMA
jgi:hypothetical protein